ncbi:MAG: hypothetical protein OSJ70_09845 [Bacilli bacterium]|nr:hypothetical protein [Bacilli bacterium]
MKKFRFYIFVSIAVLFFGIGGVYASDDDFINVSDESSFDECVKTEGLCRLAGNIDFTSKKEIDHDVIIDLNGYTIAPDESLKLNGGLILVDRGGKLTINDSQNNGRISTGNTDNVWAAIQVLKENVGNGLAEVIINGGTIEGYYYGITGNGNYHNSKIVINGGTIKGLNEEDSAAIYHPQKGELIINNGTIKGGTGIEIRAGSLTVNNGNIEAIAPKFVKMVNKSGTTTNGVGIAVVQHVTKNPIDVVVNDGNIKGQYALYEWNPHENSEEDINKIKIQLKGGNYTGLATGVHAIYSEDLKNFISGGKYNTDVSEYITEDAKLASKTLNENLIMDVEPSKSIFPKILIGTPILLGLGVITFIFKRRKIFIFK